MSSSVASSPVSTRALAICQANSGPRRRRTAPPTSFSSCSAASQMVRDGPGTLPRWRMLHRLVKGTAAQRILRADVGATEMCKMGESNR
jgi:hypothetical protein